MGQVTQKKLMKLEMKLPEGIRGPNVKDDGIGVVYGIMLGFTGDGYSFYELKQYADDIRDGPCKIKRCL